MFTYLILFNFSNKFKLTNRECLYSGKQMNVRLNSTPQMRKFIFYIPIILSLKVIGQTKVNTTVSHVPVVYGEELKPFLDSLKATILSDTVKFKVHDVMRSADEIYNKNHYSKLFIVQHLKGANSLNSYTYKLDIVESQKVVEFANTYLHDKVVKSVTIVNEVDTTLYPHVPGIIQINLWDKAVVNPRVAGLVLSGKNNGSNFLKRRKIGILKNELRLRERS